MRNLMSKKKFELTSEMVNLDEINQEGNFIKEKPMEKAERISITIAVNKSFKSEFKAWCAINNITISEAVQKGFYLLKASPGYKK